MLSIEREFAISKLTIRPSDKLQSSITRQFVLFRFQPFFGYFVVTKYDYSIALSYLLMKCIAYFAWLIALVLYS